MVVGRAIIHVLILRFLLLWYHLVYTQHLIQNNSGLDSTIDSANATQTNEKIINRAQFRCFELRCTESSANETESTRKRVFQTRKLMQDFLLFLAPSL